MVIIKKSDLNFLGRMRFVIDETVVTELMRSDTSVIYNDSLNLSVQETKQVVDTCGVILMQKGSANISV